MDFDRSGTMVAALAEKVWRNQNVIINPRHRGAVGDGVTDDTDALVEALAVVKASHGTLYLPAGTYLVDPGALTIGASEGCSIVGDNRSRSILKATGTGNVLTYDRVADYTSIYLANFGIDGDNLATGGIYMRRVNLSRVDNVGISNVNGIGLELDACEDIDFYSLDVRRCGNFAGSLPGVKVHCTTADTNSIGFMGGDIERCKYHGMLIDSASAIRTVGMKFHGRTTADEATPDAVNLLHLLGVKRSQVFGCQFSQGRQYGIYAHSNSGGTASAVSICANTFNEPANYQTLGQAWNVVIAAARAVVDSNIFFYGDHASYTSLGGDIWATSAMLNLQGANQHQASAGTQVKNDTTVNLLTKTLSGKENVGQSSSTPMAQWSIDGEGFARFDLQASSIRIGGGAAAVDVVLGRHAANMLGLNTGDSFALLGGYIECGEIADPSAPASDKSRLYTRDNGVGKTQLVVRFPTGAIQVIATEP
jgi:hypothetical protein